MPTFRNRPVTIEAEQFFENQPLPFADIGPIVFKHNDRWCVRTIFDHITPLVNGDWVIREPQEPLRARALELDVFQRLYEPNPQDADTLCYRDATEKPVGTNP